MASAFGMNEKYTNVLMRAAEVADSTIKGLVSEWQVEKFPNFLKSCYMHKNSWEFTQASIPAAYNLCSSQQQWKVKVRDQFYWEVCSRIYSPCIVA